MYIDLDDYRDQLVEGLNVAWESCKECIEVEQEKMKETHDRKARECPLKVNDIVRYYLPTVPKGKTHKLSRNWVGPFRVILLKGNNASIRKLGVSKRVEDKWVNVCQLKKVLDPLVPDRQKTEPESLLESELVQEVDMNEVFGPSTSKVNDIFDKELPLATDKNLSNSSSFKDFSANDDKILENNLSAASRNGFLNAQGKNRSVIRVDPARNDKADTKIVKQSHFIEEDFDPAFEDLDRFSDCSFEPISPTSLSHNCENVNNDNMPTQRYNLRPRKSKDYRGKLKF